MLSREAEAFTVKNIEEDERAYDELLALGFRTIPVTVAGTRIVKGFDEAALMDALVAIRTGR